MKQFTLFNQLYCRFFRQRLSIAPRSLLLSAGLFFGCIHSVFSQDGFADLQIRVYEARSASSKTSVPVSGALITIYLHNAWVSSDTTPANGVLRYATMAAGEYRIYWSKPGYISDSDLVEVKQGPNREYPIQMVNIAGMKTDSAIHVTWKKPPPPIVSVGVGTPPLTRSKLLERAGDPNGSLIKSNPNIIRAGAGSSFRGSRWDANRTFIDGALDNGTGLNTLGTEMLGATLGGVPANKGDFTGGSFDWVTRSAGLKPEYAMEMISSTKLDPFGYNSLAGFASGPLWVKKYKDRFSKTQHWMKLGYVLNGQYTWLQDGAPTATGVYRINEDSRIRTEQNPLTYTPSGFVYSASFLTQNDFTLVKTHPNSSAGNGNFYGKLEFRPTAFTTLTGFAKLNFGNGFAANNQIMNFAANGRTDNRALLAYLQWTQTLKTAKDGPVKGAYYTIRADYYNQLQRNRDASHLDNIFDYGYLGSFRTYTDEVFTFAGATSPNAASRKVIDQFGKEVWVNNIWEQSGWKDTLITFTASGKNPVREAYTQNVMDVFNSREMKIQNKNQILNNLGLLNGYNPGLIYSLWQAPGTMVSGFGKSSAERYSLFAQGQLSYTGNSVKNLENPTHDLQFGFFYEQQVQRSYNLNANGLWQLMPQLMNSHLAEIDKDHPILSYDANGVFTDTMRYNRLVNYAAQSHFDRAFRNSLIQNGARDNQGKQIDERTFVDINSYAPGDFKLEMFNADELLNNGNGYVSYYGFDHLGNKTRGRKSISDFLDDPGKRSVDAFRPVYMAAWLQDQFRFKDLIFRLGVRMERYDANQSVLADPWSLYPIKTAGEVKTLNGSETIHPANIGSDYKVYVDDVKSPTHIVGYRNGDKWFNSDGSEQANPEFLANRTSNGQIAPLLQNPNQNGISAATFRDFHPNINILPRIWFSFPLVPEKETFYVSYDVLAQRPSLNASFLTIDEVFYLKNRQGSTISNGQLGPRIRTNYEAGYKHVFGKKGNKGIEFSTSYSEIRRDFGLSRISQAYPVTYVTYRNIDFSTITSFQTSFVMNNIGPLSVYAGYMLQFADGTGSNVNSQAALIASNQPNLRNVIPLGELDVRHNIKTSATWSWKGGYDKLTRRNLYTGPVIGRKEILRNTSINITANAYSGLPYTPTTRPVQIGATDRAQVKGVPFGARMGWQKFADINIAKNIVLRKGSDASLIQIFLAVQNVFNTRNIISVFPYTGQPNDDGFLNSPQGNLAVHNQLSAQSYTDMYKMLLNSQSGNYGSPRVTRIGMRLFFN